MNKINSNIIKKCLDKDYKAIEYLYKNLYGLLFGVSIRYQQTPEDAEELTNDSFIKVIANLKKYNNKVPFIPWVRRVCINLNIDKLRSKKRKTLGHPVELEAIKLHKFEYNQGFDELNKDDLLCIIKQIAPMEQKVFNLYAIDGYKHKEISKMLSIPIGTSKSYLFRARKMLQEKLKQINTFNEKKMIYNNG